MGNLVRFAHNWNNGMLEQWNIGLWESGAMRLFANFFLKTNHYPIWPTWNMFHIIILLFQHVIEVPIHDGSISGPYRISVFSIVCIAPKLPYSIVSDRCIGYNGE